MTDKKETPCRCSLEDILAARDARRQKQMRLLKAYPDKTLICLTVIMPGEIKCNEYTPIIGAAACQAIEETFKDKLILPDEADCNTKNVSKTGFEAFFLVSLPPVEVKRQTVRIEETHGLGRLFDIDVIEKDCVPISRNEIGEKPRQCLLCNDEARICMRKHTHTHEELLTKIRSLVEDWQNKHMK